MIDLNDFLEVIKSGEIEKDRVTVVRKQGMIVDYVLPHETVRENEVAEVMDLRAIVSEIFELC